MSELMQSLRVHAWNAVPTLDDVARPEPRAGESLVRIEAAAVSHFDLTVLGGDFNIRPDLPYVGGAEGAGTIVASDRFEPGTRVALRGGGLGLTRNGTWADYAAVSDDFVRLVPERLSSELAATSFSPLTTAHVSLHDVGRLGDWSFDGHDEGVGAQGEVVAVTGAAGAVGSIVVQLAARAGARVIGLVSRQESVAFVPNGAETVVTSDEAATASLARERPITLLIDTIGGPGFNQRLEWVRPGGRTAMVGYTAGKDVALNLPNWFLNDVTILPVNLMRRSRRANEVIGSLTELLVDGALVLNVESFPMSEAAAAFQRLRQGQVRGRLVLRPGG